MDEIKYRLSKPLFSTELSQNIATQLETGYLVQGDRVKEFENHLSEYLGGGEVIAVSSGTAALHLALLQYGIGPGDEVILPAFSFAATLNVVMICGATPVFVDIDPENLCIDTRKIEDAVTERTVAIMPVHEFGAMPDMNDLLSIAHKHGLLVIEDAACALGSEFKEKKAGTFGNIGCFSFHPRKVITTGEGGALYSNDKKISNKLRALRNHGNIGGAQNENFLFPGLNYRMTELQAIIGLEQLQQIERYISIRRQQANLYIELLGNCNSIKIPRSNQNIKHIYQTFLIQTIDDKREALQRFLREHGIESSIGAQFLPELGYMPKDINVRKYPIAYDAYSKGLAIPLGPHLSYSDIEYIANIIKEYDQR